ncbi:hypothetical protein LTR60_003498, partial [Cryomyces antarcticus]
RRRQQHPHQQAARRQRRADVLDPQHRVDVQRRAEGHDPDRRRRRHQRRPVRPRGRLRRPVRHRARGRAGQPAEQQLEQRGRVGAEPRAHHFQRRRVAHGRLRRDGDADAHGCRGAGGRCGGRDRGAGCRRCRCRRGAAGVAV